MVLRVDPQLPKFFDTPIGQRNKQTRANPITPPQHARMERAENHRLIAYNPPQNRSRGVSRLHHQPPRKPSEIIFFANVQISGPVRDVRPHETGTSDADFDAETGCFLRAMTWKNRSGPIWSCCSASGSMPGTNPSLRRC